MMLGGISSRDAACYISAQILGGVTGSVVANLMFALPAVTLSHHARSGGGIWLGEVVATFGLVLVVFGVTRTRRGGVPAFAVGAYIAGAYFFTSSTSFANPAVAVARSLSDTFAGIAPSSVPMFVVAELVGGIAGLVLVRFLYSGAPRVTADVLMPHDDRR